MLMFYYLPAFPQRKDGLFTILLQQLSGDTEASLHDKVLVGVVEGAVILTPIRFGYNTGSNLLLHTSY